jgi:hypothetical protein
MDVNVCMEHKKTSATLLCKCLSVGQQYRLRPDLSFQDRFLRPKISQSIGVWSKSPPPHPAYSQQLFVYPAHLFVYVVATSSGLISQCW